MTFSDFLGNRRIADALHSMAARDALPHTLLFAGPMGVGKATLARLLAAAMNCSQGPGELCTDCANCRRILRADLSLPEFEEQIAERRTLPAAKRNETPLVISTHPDFLIFPPDGPMQLVTIEQGRELRRAGNLNPSQGRQRVFLIDHADRATEDAANSLLKTLEEPAPALTIILTAENPNELLPTIRSRSVPFYFSPLSEEEMERFLDSRPEIQSASDRRRLLGWSQGSPGRALRLDAEEYLARRESMVVLLATALNAASFGDLLPHAESVARRRQEPFEMYLEMLTGLLQDVVHLKLDFPRGLIHPDLRNELAGLAQRVSQEWLERAVLWLGELEEYRRRNIQRQIALEGMAADLRDGLSTPRARA